MAEGIHFVGATSYGLNAIDFIDQIMNIPMYTIAHNTSPVTHNHPNTTRWLVQGLLSISGTTGGGHATSVVIIMPTGIADIAVCSGGYGSCKLSISTTEFTMSGSSYAGGTLFITPLD